MNGKPLKKNGGKISILDILYFGKYILRYLLFESKRIVFRGSQTSTHTSPDGSGIPQIPSPGILYFKRTSSDSARSSQITGLTVSFGLTVCVLSSFP